MSKTRIIEIEGLTLAITKLSAAGKSAKAIHNYFECEQLLAGETFPLNKAVGAKRGRKKAGAKAKRKRTVKGAIGEFILKLLSKKGDEGAHVKEIAKALKSKPANVVAWFYGTGKKIKGIRRVKPNTFAYKGE